MTKVVELHGDRKVMTDRLFDRLYEMAAEHGNEHDMSVAEVIGVLEAVKMELYLTIRFGDDED